LFRHKFHPLFLLPNISSAKLMTGIPPTHLCLSVRHIMAYHFNKNTPTIMWLHQMAVQTLSVM